MRKTFGLVIAIGLICLDTALAQEKSAQPDPSTLGMSATKPESGPFVQVAGGFMVPYLHKFENTSISFEMIPVPGGEVTIGSPESEAGRSEDEGPQFTVVIEPFWMAKTELTWGEYKTFMRTYDVFKNQMVERDEPSSISFTDRSRVGARSARRIKERVCIWR